MDSCTWRPCWNDPSIWRMFYVRPDRELLITVDLSHAKLLSFELEWNDAEDRRHYVTWGPKKGFEIGVVDLDETCALPEGLLNHRIPSAASPDVQVLKAARRIVEGACLEKPVCDWVLDRLPA